MHTLLLRWKNRCLLFSGQYEHVCVCVLLTKLHSERVALRQSVGFLFHACCFYEFGGNSSGV